MRIMNQKVEHNKFGQGTVFALRDKKVYVAFGKLFGDKFFPYPDVFKEDMHFCDEEIQEEIRYELA